MARFPVAPFTKGLSTLVDAAAGDPQASPDLKDVRGHTGILTLRKGYRVLDIEPSHVDTLGSAKAVQVIGFDPVTPVYAYNTAWNQTLGQKWTILLHAQFANATNKASGTRYILFLDGAQDPVTLQAIGDGTNIIIRAIVKDTAGNTITLNSTTRTLAAWQAILAYSSGYIRLVRDGTSLSLYINETLEASSSGFTSNAHDQATALYVASDAAFTNGAEVTLLGSLVILNRVLTEEECYWGLRWPTDARSEGDVLGNWPFIEATGTTITDYSANEKNLTLNNAGAWSGTTHQAARGLGVGSWRRSNGDIYHVLVSTRRSTASTGATPSGALYTWKASGAFTPFYFGGDPGNGDDTANLSGLNPFARWSFAQGRDMLIGANGSDYCRKYRTSAQYLGGTAPPTAPVLNISTGTTLTGTFTYAYSYYNSATGTETGLSPTASASPSGKDVKVTWFLSSDTQFDYVRIYRSKTGEPTLYLLTELAMAATNPYTDTKSDANLGGGVLCPGSDVSGNRSRKRAFLAFPDFPNTPPSYFTPRGITTRSFPPGAAKGAQTAPTLGQSNTGPGALTLTTTYYVAYSYYCSADGTETGMSPATSILLTGANDTIDVSAMVLPPEASKYDKIRLYRTKGDAFTWYLEQTITAAATATITQADSALTTTIETHALPPRFEGLCVFANRLWGFVGPTLYWSTAGFFEDFPEANGFAAKSGVDIRAICATEGVLFVHYADGTIHALPHPGDEPDLAYFVPLNLKQWSPIGAAVGHFTSQAVPGGLIWLARDGFYFANGTTLDPISRAIAPAFLNLNAARGSYFCSLYDDSRRIYRCWVSRSNKRLNEECFVYYLDDRSWWLDNLHADAAGVLYDAKANPHYCFLVENGVLCELDETLDYDGDGSGTLSATLGTTRINGFANMTGYTAPTGGDGGYPIYLVKSDGTTVQRYRLDDAVAGNPTQFYPAYVGITSGSWTGYYHGIRGYIKTMLLHLGDLRHPKNIISMFFLNRVQSAGGLQVNLARDEGTLTAVNQDVDLTLPVSQVTPAHGSGRVFQLEIYSDPPAASRPWGLKGLEIEAEMDMTDAGS